jgi:hypothetical protein
MARGLSYADEDAITSPLGRGKWAFRDIAVQEARLFGSVEGGLTRGSSFETTEEDSVVRRSSSHISAKRCPSSRAKPRSAAESSPETKAAESVVG